ncbi:psbP domain-containing protein 2, chloroplastic [Mercurialis annua]|uniref:psbP domain-containing protein 2, chloroplastic n=1 Tax=Mercurialis annua TaxID=3986 RepID=UPI00215E10D1|nr:psbP domain-containing protein 2, chloroplastic [Mercurialis annua]
MASMLVSHSNPFPSPSFSSSKNFSSKQTHLCVDCDRVILESEQLHRPSVSFYDVLQNHTGGGKPNMRYFKEHGWPSSTVVQKPPRDDDSRAELIDTLQDSETESKNEAAVAFSWSKRQLHLAVLALLVNGSVFTTPKTILAIEMEELETYTDATEGFTFLRPSSYLKVDKAGATVLFEDVDKKSNTIGVVVNPVRLTTLAEFGTPQFVADKLIQAEKRKESTKEAEVIALAERSSHGVQVYEFEYIVDSTRGGMKRIFSAAFVASKKLYLLNITHSDTRESPMNTSTRMVLEKVLHSFDIPYTT